MSFELSPELDKNKVFLINSCELEGRIDPFFYTPQFDDVKRIEKLSKYPIKKVSHLSIIVTDGIHKTPSYSNEGLPFIQANNISEGSIDFKNNIKKVTEQWQTEVLKRYTPKAGDVLITKDGTIGIAATVPSKFSPFSIFVSVLAIRPREDLIIPEYLRILISSEIVQNQIVRSTRGAVLSHLLLEEARELKIPIPPKEIQSKVVAIMDTAYTRKKQKEAEAKTLLNSIDDYLLDELGIELPEQEKNTIQNRMFIRQLSELSGGRFDPFFSSLNKQDRSGKYQFYKLKELAQIRKGDSITSDDVVDGLIPVIAGGQTSPYNHNIANSNGDVITVSASGAYSGYVWYHESSIFASDCTMISSKNTNKLSNKYIFEYLKTEQQDIYNLQQGSGQPHVYPSDLEKIKIPVPPPEKQVEIVNHITKIRNQAKALQQQAKEELEQAKKEVESMLLGEDAKKA